MKAPLTESDFNRAASDLDVPVAAIKAFAAVESRGTGFMRDGHPVVLFERHIMYRRILAKYGSARASALAKQFPDLINPKAGGYGKESEQPKRMDRAAKLIDRDCALESASWGAFQVMGYHWRDLGYPTLQAFINAMYRSEADHLDSFVRYIKANPSLHRSLKALDWPKVALGYNGPNYATNKYDTKMAQAYELFSTT